jgi:ribosomal protein S3
VSTIPGGIFPGFKVTIKVAAQGIIIGIWSSTLRITVKEVNENTTGLAIPVEINFVESNETNAEVQPEVITITK